MNAQASYPLQTFSVNAASWTGFVHYTGATTCGGSGGATRFNVYSSAPTANFVSPSMGTSNGALVTLSYDYKICNWSANTVGTPTTFGNFNVQYGASASGPWTTAATINSANHIVSGSCVTKVVTFTPPSGPLFVRFNATWGTGDYYLNFDNISLSQAPGSPCTTPAPGNTVSSAASVCSGANFTLSVQNSTPGATVTQQWQSADDAGFTVNLVNLGTATTQVTNQTTAKYYRSQVTCSVGPVTVPSNPLLVGMNSNYCFCTAYCASNATNSADTKIDSIKVDGVGFGSLATVCETYTLTTTAGYSWDQGTTHSMRIRNGSCSGVHYTAYYSVYADWNQNGVFTDPGETVQTGGPTTALNTISDFNFTVPALATLGATRMRVVLQEAIVPPPACGTYLYGETEDFCISITAPPACSGTPTPGNTVASSSTVCAGGSVNLSLQNPTVGTGVTYQWQSSADNITYSNVAGTLSTYTTNPLVSNTYFRGEVTCSTGPSIGYSNSQLISITTPPVGGTASGPLTGVTYQNLAYSVTGTTGNLQWQFSTTGIGGPYADIPLETTAALNITANAGGTYYVRSKASNAGCTDAFSNVITTVVSVAGDNVCSALPLALGLNGPYTNVGATTEGGEVGPPGTGFTTQTGWGLGQLPSNSIWFTFVAPPSGRVSIGNHTSLNLWDNQFALYSASACSPFGGFTLIAANDDSTVSSPPYKAWIAPVCLVPGQTYYLQVDGFGSTTNASWGINLISEASILPTASISGSAEICAGGNTNLTLNFTGTAPWTYSINGGAPQSTSNNPETVNVAPASTTVYTITSLGDNSCPGGSGIVSGSATVTVTNAPPASSTTVALPTPDACVGDVVVFSTNVVPGATSYTWSAPAGTLIDGSVSPYTTNSNTVNVTLGAVAPNSSGWLICAFASNACGITNTNCKFIRGVLSAPSPITGSTIACASSGPDNYSITAVAGASSYLWTITGDASVTGTGTVGAVTFGPAFTSGSLCVRALLPCGYQGPQRCLAIANGTPILGVMTGTFTVCPGTNGVAFSVPPSLGATTYNWTVPTGATVASGAGTNSITVNFGPTYTIGNVCVTAQSVCGATSLPRCKTVASITPGTPGNFTTGATSGVCGQTITYSINSVSGATGYTWTAPAGASLASANGTNTIDIAFSPGYTTGNVCVTADNACGSGTPRCVLVKGTPSNPGVITGLNSVCANDAGVGYSIAPLFGATGYLWTVPSGATIVSGQGTTAIIVDYGANGGTIGVTASGTCGNSGTRTLIVAMNCRVSSSTLPGASVNAYPNPVSTQFNVELNAINAGTYTVELMDLAGRVIYSDVITATEGINNAVIDVATYAKGVYTMSVRNSDGFAQQIRVVVE